MNCEMWPFVKNAKYAEYLTVGTGKNKLKKCQGINSYFYRADL